MHFFVDTIYSMYYIACMEYRKSIADKVKRYRMSRLWTLHQMADATGITLRTIWMIETNKVKPHDLTIAKIKRALPDFEKPKTA